MRWNIFIVIYVFRTLRVAFIVQLLIDGNFLLI